MGHPLFAHWFAHWNWASLFNLFSRERIIKLTSCLSARTWTKLGSRSGRSLSTSGTQKRFRLQFSDTSTASDLMVMTSAACISEQVDFIFLPFGSISPGDSVFTISIVWIFWKENTKADLWLIPGLHKIEIGLGTKFQYQFSAWFSCNFYAVW